MFRPFVAFRGFKPLLALLFAGGVSIVAVQSTEASISVTIDDSLLWVVANGNFQGQHLTSFGPSVTDENVSGGAVARVTYDFSKSDGTAIFDISFEQLSFLANNDDAFGAGHIDFTLGESVNYEVSGVYWGSGTDPDDSHVYMASLFGSYDEPDVLKGTLANFSKNDIAEGNLGATMSGSRTGALGVGSHRFHYFAGIQDEDGDGLGTGDAGGYVRLTLTSQQNAIPEPSTYLIFTGLIACFGLAGWWRGRTRGT